MKKKFDIWKEQFDLAFPTQRDEFNENVRNTWGYVKLDTFKSGSSTHCFAGMNGKGAGVTHLLNGIHRQILPDKKVRAYFQWLLNESPFSRIFLTKNVDEVLKDRIEIIDANHPSGIILGGMTASRTSSEYPYLVNIWYELTQLGVHPSIAFYYAHLFRAKALKPTNIAIYPQAWNHATLNARDANDSYVISFLRGKSKKEGTYTERGSYNSVQDIWIGETTTLTVRKKIISWWNNLEITGKSSNPFVTPSSEISELDMDAETYRWGIQEEGAAREFNQSIKLIAEYLREGYKGEI
jgi:hypothetical protein